MRVVASRMAYSAAKDRRITAYQAQYFWHVTHRRARAGGRTGRVIVPALGVLRWAAVAGLMLAAALTLAALAVLSYVAIQIVVIIVGS
jgi:hypothetical protein